jgi:uncharacterized protein YgiB involved in biofilm formation
MKMQPAPFESSSQSLFVREPNGMVMHVSIGGARRWSRSPHFHQGSTEIHNLRGKYLDRAGIADNLSGDRDNESLELKDGE